MRISKNMNKSLRVLIAKPGLDGHDRGALFLKRALTEHGFDVEYTGIRQTPISIAAQAKEFRADVVGISILSGAHMELIPRVIEQMEAVGMGEIPIIIGGIIPEIDRIELLEMGVVGIFGPGSKTNDIVTKLLDIKSLVNKKR